MHVTVLHNPRSGAGRTDMRELRRLVEAAGHEVVYRSTKASGWKRAVRDVRDVALVVGGDGTVAKVARRLAGRPTPMAIVATGTANNIARAVGAGADAAHVVAALAHASQHPFDLGTIAGGPEDQYFAEAVGLGLIPELIAESGRRRKAEDVPPHEELSHSVALAAELLELAPVLPCRIVADGADISGEYLMVEVMNIRTAGPRLAFAPDADPGDGMLDVVALPESSREAAHDAICRGQPFGADVPALRRRARRVELEWRGSALHIDDALWPGVDEEAGGAGGGMRQATIGIEPGSVTMLR